MCKWAKLHQGLFVQSVYQSQSRSRTLHLFCHLLFKVIFPISFFFFFLDRKMTQLQAFKRTSLKVEPLLFVLVSEIYVACVAGIKRGMGRGNLGSRSNSLPLPFWTLATQSKIYAYFTAHQDQRISHLSQGVVRWPAWSCDCVLYSTSRCVSKW